MYGLVRNLRYPISTTAGSIVETKHNRTERLGFTPCSDLYWKRFAKFTCCPISDCLISSSDRSSGTLEMTPFTSVGFLLYISIFTSIGFPFLPRLSHANSRFICPASLHFTSRSPEANTLISSYLPPRIALMLLFISLGLYVRIGLFWPFMTTE